MLNLYRRYDYISQCLSQAEACSELAAIDHDGFRDLLSVLDDLGVIIGYDILLNDRSAVDYPRFATTLVLPDRPPLIWVNRRKHLSLAELVDTIVHEAIHSTVRCLKRHLETPQPDIETTYYGEELVSLAGTNIILHVIQFPAQQQVARNLIAIEQCRSILFRLGCDERFLRHRFMEADAAAAFLTDVGIKVAIPSLEALNRRSRLR